MRLIGIDFESTFVPKVRGASELGPMAYAMHSDTEVFLVSAYDGKECLVADPYDLAWEEWEDLLSADAWVSHNRTFDKAIFHRLWHDLWQTMFPDKDICWAVANIPSLTPHWHCSADLAAYCGVKRDLPTASKHMLGMEIKKTTRNKFARKTKAEIFDKMGDEVFEYAEADAIATWRIWTDYSDQFPEHERRLSEWTTEICHAGVGVDVDLLESEIGRMEMLVWSMVEEIPWTGKLDPKGKPYTPLSRKALEAHCASVGIPRPKSMAKDSPFFDEWLEEYGEGQPWAKVLGDYRSASRILDLLQGVRKRINVRSYHPWVMPYGLKYAGAHTLRWCLPSSYEVLTPCGWQTLGKWTAPTPIMQWAPSGALTWCDAKKVKFKGDGPGRKFESKNLNIVCTPEHRLPVIKRESVTSRTADDIWRVRVQISIIGHFHGMPTTSLTSDEVRLYVATQADGHFYSGEKGSGLKFAFRKGRKIDRMDALLTRLGIPFKRNEYSDRTAFNFNSWAVPWFLSKTFKLGFLLTWGRSQREVFIEELVHWDGYQSPNSAGFQYTTCIRENAETVATVAHLSGRSATVNVKVRAEAGWSDSYSVFISKERTRTLTPDRWSPTWMSRAVYCATTETGYFLCRTPTGEIFISGNSGDGGVNMQNPPREAIHGCNFRNIFVPRYDDLVYVVSDLSQIEARVLLWCVKDEEQLEMIRGGMDLYEAHARRTMGYSEAEPLSEVNPKLRFFAKVRVLALGYMTGAVKFRQFAKSSYGLDLTPLEAKRQVKDFRRKNPKITRYWDAKLHEVTRGSKQDPNRDYFMPLPSGRHVCYYNVTRDRGWKAENQLGRGMMYIHGGKIVENEVSAIARDLLAEATLRIHSPRTRIVLSIHDELVCEVESRYAEELKDEIEAKMTMLPEWADGLPISCESKITYKYEK